MTTPDLLNPSAGRSDRPATGSAFTAAAVTFFIALICYFPLPFNSPLAGTEGHRALTAHQMVESGQWLVPCLYGRVYLAKPPMHYWLIATMETITGQATPFFWRLPSALVSASLAMTLCLFARRWFGTLAGWVSGISYVTIFCLWGSSRTADIDITNALTSTIAALCLLELNLGAPQRRWIWIIAAGVAAGAGWMTKGPATLPPILGAMIWCAISHTRHRQIGRLLWPAFWLPLVMGVILFGLYGLAVWHFLSTHHMAMDTTGLQEGATDVHPHDWSAQRAIEWILLAPILFLYSLPVSLALPLSLSKTVRGTSGPRSELMLGLAMTVLASWAVCFVSGMHLPRYAYLTLPAMCPLAGAVAARWSFLSPRLRGVINGTLLSLVVILAAVVVTVSGIQWRHHDARVALAAAVVLAIATAVVMVRKLVLPIPPHRVLWLLPILLMALAIDVDCAGHYDRLRRSSLVQGEMIRSITGPGVQIFTCQMVLDQPELFYYTGLPTRALDGDVLDWRQLPLGTWVVLEDPELKVWQHEVPEKIKWTQPFVANRNPGYLVWYGDDTPSISSSKYGPAGTESAFFQ